MSFPIWRGKYVQSHPIHSVDPKLVQRVPHRLKSEGASLKLVDVELESCIEVELSFAESFDDWDP